MKNQLLASVSSLALALAPMVGYANPTGGSVVGGDATITQETPSTLVIQQSSDRAVINWTDFSIGAGETTRFDQPNSSSVTLNRVTGGQVSQILGNLQANGHVYLVNPNGVVFGQGAQVDVAGLVATTANIQTPDFMAGVDAFTQPGLDNAQVINAGTITAADGGLVALVAPVVKNSGTITARLGKVTLAGGQTFTLDLYGDQLVALTVNDDTLDTSLAENSGAIAAAGGYIVLTAGQAKAALDNVVNMSGTMMADTLNTENGRIVLGSSQGFTEVSGQATANNTNGNGGTVDVLGTQVALRDGATLQTNGSNGGGDIHVGGNYQGNGPLPNAARTLVEAGTTLQANATDNGDGGNIIVWADELTGFAGHAEATGGTTGGNGGFVEVSGKEGLVFNGTVDTTAAQGEMGTLLLDPTNIVIHDGFGQADDGQVSDGTILGADGGAVDFDISEVALETLSSGTNVTLEATNNITINDLSNDALNLTATGDVILKADSDSSGVGDFIMLDTNDIIQTGGANLTISGANLTIGGIDTANGVNGNVTLTGSTGTTLYGDISTNDGNWIINGPLTLASNMTYSTGAGAGSIIFSDSISGDYTMVLDLGSTGNVTFRDVDIDTLSFASGNNVNLNGTLETDSVLNFTNMVGDLTLTGNSAIYARDGVVEANLTFPATMDINGAYDLDLIGDTLTLQRIGNSSPLNSLTVAGNTVIDIGNDITTTGAQSYTGDTNLGANLITSDNNVTITGNVNVPTAMSVYTGSGAGDIDITGTLDGTYSVSLDAGTGSISIGGAVGGTNPLGQLTADGSTLDFSNGVLSTGSQTYTGTATIGGSFTSVNTNIAFNNAVTLAGNTTLNTNTAAGNITFNSTVDGAYNLTADAGSGITSFGGDVGGVTPLANIDISGNSVAVSTMISTGAQTYTGALSLDGALQVASGALNLNGNITLLGDSSITSGGGVADHINITGNVTGDYILALIAGGGDISLGTVDVDTLTLTSGDDLTIGTTITTDTAQDYTNIDTITTSGNTTFTAYDGSNYYDLTFDAANIITASGNITMLGDTVTLYDISGVQQLDVTGNTAIALNSDLTSTDTMTFSGGPLSLGGTLTTANADMTFNSPITLTADSVLDTGSGAGDVTLAGTVDGAYSLTITSGTGDATAAGDVGTSTPLTAFDVTAQNISVANVTTSGVQDYTGNITGSGLLSGGSAVNVTGDAVLGGGVTTSNGSVLIDGNVTLTADSIIQSGGTAADAITINGDIGGDYNLDLAAGSADINISGDVDINRWDLTSGDTLTLGSGSFTTDETMDFSNISDIILSADTVFTANDGSTAADITMGPNNDITGPYNLTFNGADVSLYGIGDPNSMSNSPLSLTVNATYFVLYGAVYTQNEQTYTSLDGLANDLVTNGADIILNTDLQLEGDVTISTGTGSSGNITFGGPVDGAYNLVVEAGDGSVTAGSNFGENTPLTSLILTGAAFDLYNVTTTGDQNYTGPMTMYGSLNSLGGNITVNDTVTLADDVVISSGANLGGDITFNDTIDGAHDLTLTAGTGNVVFNEALGTTERLGVLTISNVDSLTMGAGAKVTRFVQTGATGDTIIVGDSPGLDSIEGIHIASPSYIAGRLTSSEIYLASSGTMDVAVYTDQLTIGGQGSRITGFIGGEGGYQAARQVRFSSLSGGPHSMNGYNIPLLDDITSPQVLNTTALGNIDSPLAVTANATPNSARELNPFSGRYQLIVADETGLLPAAYLTGALWEDQESAIPLSSVDIEL